MVKLVKWLKFIKIGTKNAEIGVLEQLEPKIFFATQPWWVAFKEPVNYKNAQLTKFSLFPPLKYIFLNNLGNKHRLLMEFAHFMSYLKMNNFIKKIYKKCALKTSSRPFCVCKELTTNSIGK